MDVEELLGQMTLEEKCAQLGGVWYSALLVEGQLDESRMEELLSDGIGQVARIASTGLRSRSRSRRPTTASSGSSRSGPAWASPRSPTRRRCRA